MTNEGDTSTVVAIQQAQLILAEKRTSLATLRTGIAVFLLPLSVLSVLVATSRYYNVLEVMHLLVPLAILSGGLAILGVYLISRAVVKIRKFDRMLHGISSKNERVAELLE